MKFFFVDDEQEDKKIVSANILPLTITKATRLRPCAVVSFRFPVFGREVSGCPSFLSLSLCNRVLLTHCEIMSGSNMMPSEPLSLAAQHLSVGASQAASWIGSQTASAVNRQPFSAPSAPPPSASSSYGRETVALIAAGSLALGAGLTYAWLNYEKLFQENDATTEPVKSPQKYGIPAEIAASPFREHVELAIGLALQAGDNMRSYCDEKGTYSENTHDLHVSFKGKPEDFCTKIDVENEHLLMEGIRRAFPTHKIIGEETTGTGEIPPLTKYPTWILDPIDGTTNFAR